MKVNHEALDFSVPAAVHAHALGCRVQAEDQKQK